MLSHKSGGMPGTSPRGREMIEPEGGADEMRAPFADAFGVWGSLSLFADRRFAPHEAEMLAELAPVFTQGLRVAIARMPAAATKPDTQPTVVVLDSRDRVIAADLRARCLIAGIAGDAPGEIPGSFYVLAAQARQRNPTRPASARARDRDGNWVSIDVSPLDDEPHGSVALILQPASLQSRLEALLRALGLSEREREVAQLAVLGRSTKAMAAELFLSPWTVQDHLKNISRKPASPTAGRSQHSSPHTPPR